MAKSAYEIRDLLVNAKLGFESVEDKTLTGYLPKIFCSCSINEDPCVARKLCCDCGVLKKHEAQPQG